MTPRLRVREKTNWLQHVPGGLGGLLAGGLTLQRGWGFSVDDALISSRVAHHLAQGIGYRFNPQGPEVDCVTPMGWAALLAPFSADSTLIAYFAARSLSALAWLLASCVLGVLIAQCLPGWRRWTIYCCIALCLPLGTWAASGMETGLATLLCVLALLPNRWAPLAAGLAAVLRPELTPWALAMALGFSWSRRAKPLGYALHLAMALLPFVGVCLLRLVWFGRAAPLAVFAKPSDTVHGLQYLWGAMLLSGPTFLLATRHWRQDSPTHLQSREISSRTTIALAAAVAVHALVLIGVGGDWMPLWRLAVPVYPAIFLVGARLAAHSSTIPFLLRLAPALILSGLWQWHQGATVRGVLADRLALISRSRLELPQPLSIATVDVGWVGALGAHQVIDLAGVTDERIAYLPGGHTSKQLPKSFLRQRAPDALLLLLRNSNEWQTLQGTTLQTALALSPFSRQVENKLTQMTEADLYRAQSRLALGRQSYVLYRRIVSP